MIMDKILNMRISRNLDTSTKIKVKDTVVKEIEKFIYLGSENNSERKIAGEIKRRINSSYKL
jgi:16S rRNA C1402 N4-methylase RsmH